MVRKLYPTANRDPKVMINHPQNPNRSLSEYMKLLKKQSLKNPEKKVDII